MKAEVPEVDAVLARLVEGQTAALGRNLLEVYVFGSGEHVSKRHAADWVSEMMPEHAELIRAALVWRERSRRSERPEPMNADDVRRFMREISALLS